MEGLVGALYSAVPSGVGQKGDLRLDRKELSKVILNGSGWATGRGMADQSDLDNTESGGVMDDADPDAISDKAYERGSEQLGTLGAGNHFVELQSVDEIYDPEAAAAMGLFEGQLTMMIHTGSRGFGHQVCTDYIGVMRKVALREGISLPDSELACAPIETPEARRYLSAMKGAANYAWANRQVIEFHARQALMGELGMSPRDLGMRLVYDVAHNIAKFERHEFKGKMRNLLVHRKGATRAFAPGHPDLPDHYRKTGQPVIIPGDMGRASYVLAGLEGAMRQTWGSTCHGAGRIMSRQEAIRQARGHSLPQELKDRGVAVMAHGRRTLAEEMPEAYKDINSVVAVAEGAGLARKVARLRPMGVIKG